MQNLRRKKSYWFKALSAYLAFSLVYLNVAQALDVRQSILDAKAGFELYDEGKKSGNFKSFALNQAIQDNNQEEVDRLNDLLGFNLTTPNGDIISYIGDTIDHITRLDGTVLSNVTVDAEGNIIGADLFLSDNSVQIFDGGKVVGYRRPDGTQLLYEGDRISESIALDGSVTSFTHSLDTDGNVIETIAENELFKVTYNSDGVITLSHNKNDLSNAIYENGRIKRVDLDNGQAIHFKESNTNSQITLEFDHVLDANLIKRYYKDGLSDSFVLTDGRIMQDFIFNADKTAILDYKLYGNDGSLLSESGALDYPSLAIPTLIKWDTFESKVPFQYAIYHETEGTLQEILTSDEVKLVFDSEGLLTSITDSDGIVSEYDLSLNELSNIVTADISRSGLTSTYDETGRLKSVAYVGFTIHYKSNVEEIDYIEKDNGSELYNLVFDSEGVITGADVYDPDGNLYIYKDAELEKYITAEELEYDFLDGVVLKLTTPDELIYNFTYSADIITADIDLNIEIPDALTTIQMQYDTDFNLQKMVRENQEILNFTNDELFSIEIPDDATKFYTYEKDSEGNITKTTVTQANVATDFNELNQATQTRITPTEDRPHLLRIEYQYGKIREVYKDDVLTFTYIYTFDEAGIESTVIEDYEEKFTKTYTDKLLLTSLSTETSILSSYEYNSERLVSKVTVTRLGRDLHTYNYTYAGDDTIVTDEEGVIRTYDSGKKLIYLERNNRLYAYAYDDETIIREDVERQLTGNHTAYYKYGEIDHIDLADGSVLSSILLGTDGTIYGGKLTYASNHASFANVQVTFDQVAVTEEINPDGTRVFLNDITQANHARTSWMSIMQAAYVEQQVVIADELFETSGKEIVTETLIRQTLTDGTLIHYLEGDVDRIVKIDGTIIEDVVLNSAREVVQATVVYATGLKRIFDENTVLEEIRIDGTHLYYTDGRLTKYVDSEGEEYGFAYELDSEGDITRVRLDRELGDYLYDASGNLTGFEVDAIQSAESILENANSIYTGGEGSDRSQDGDFGTAQFRSGNGTLYSEIHFESPQTLSEVTYRLSASSWSNGPTDNGSEARSRIEVLLAGSSTWTVVDGTDLYQSHNNGGGGGSTANAITANPSVKSLNLANVTAVRALANSGAYANGGGSSGALQYIYELGVKLFDQSTLNLEIEQDSSGDVTGFEISNHDVTYALNASGSLTGTTFTDTGNTTLNNKFNAFINSITTSFQDEVALPYMSEQSAPIADTQALFSLTQTSILDADAVYAQEYANDGLLETQTKADKSTVLFNEVGKPAKVVDQSGRTVMDYTYDENGHLERIRLVRAREMLPQQMEIARMQIEAERANKLEQLAIQEGIATETIRLNAEQIRIQIEDQVNRLTSRMNLILSQAAKGKAAKSVIADIMSQFLDVIGQAEVQIIEINTQEADAYAELDQQVQDLSDQFNDDAETALLELAEQETLIKEEILRQEVSPVIYDHYRRILGRDPASSEYQYWIDKINYDTGEVLVSEEINQVTSPGSSLTLDGSGDYVQVADHDDWNLGSGDFTIDAWIKPDKVSSLNGLVEQSTGGANGWKLAIGNGSVFFLYDGQLLFSTPAVLSVNQWAHIALVRSGNTWTIYVDGVQKAQATSSISIPNYDHPIFIGAMHDGGIRYYYDGLMDGVRISKGIARWTSNFTPSLVRYDSDDYTKLQVESTGSNVSLSDKSASNHSLTAGGNATVNSSVYKMSIMTETITYVYGNLNETVTDYLNNLDELEERELYVASIKQNVRDEITAYLAMTEAQKASYQSGLNIASEEAVNLTASDAAKVLEWLDNQSLHFGQSAFLSLESILDQKGIPYAREDIATKTIIIDILAGVITPLDEGDLILSVYALNKTASLFNLNLSGANLSWDDLQALYDENRVVIGEEITESLSAGSSLTLDGSGDYVQVADHDDWNLGSGDFTIDAWIKPDKVSSLNGLIEQSTGGANGWKLAIGNGSVFFLYDGQLLFSTPAVLSVNQWAHIALVRSGNTWTIYINGVQKAQATSSISIPNYDHPIFIGAMHDGGIRYYYDGLMDGVRISKGIARWTSDFTPSLVRYDSDDYTKLLVYADEPNSTVSDFGGSQHSLTVAGNAAVDANNYKNQVRTYTATPVIEQLPSTMDINTLTDQEKADIIANPDAYNPQVIAHINGNHFVVIKDITEDSITYTDMGIGKDKENESLTVGKDVFLKTWKGDVTLESVYAQYLINVNRQFNFDGVEAPLSWSEMQDYYDQNRVVIGEDEVLSETAGSSAYLDGNGDYLTLSDNNDWDFGTSDFSVDFWIKPETFSRPHGTQVLAGNANASQGSDGWSIYQNGSQLHFLTMHHGGVGWEASLSAAHNMTAGNWHHIAVTRSGNTFRMFMNGQVIAEGNFNANISGTKELRIGRSYSTEAGRDYFYQGHMDAFRVSKGASRWESNFTPTDVRYTKDADTALLLYVDQDESTYRDYSDQSHAAQIFGDISTDNSEYAHSVETLLTRPVIARYPVGVDLGSLSAAEKQAIIANPLKYNPHITTTINGEDLIILDILKDQIIYVEDHLSLDDPNNFKTISKQQVVAAWGDEVTIASQHETNIQALAQDKSDIARLLNVQETMEIRGAFFGSLLGVIGLVLLPFTAGLSLAFTFASSIAHFVEGSFLSGIISLVTFGAGGGFAELGTLFGGALGGLFTGVQTVFNGITSTLGQIFSGVTGFLNGAVDFASNVFQSLRVGLDAATSIAQNIVAIGVSFAISKGLEVVGAKPEIAGFFGSLAAGAVIGATSTQSATILGRDGVPMTIGVRPDHANLIKTNVLQAITINEVGTLGLELGLDSELTRMIGLSLGSIQGISVGASGSAALDAAFMNISPVLSSSLAFYGVNELGTSLGIDPRISSLIGAGVGSAIGDGFELGKTAGETLIDAVSDGLIAGAVGYTANMAIDVLNLHGLAGDLALNMVSRALLNMTESQQGLPRSDLPTVLTDALMRTGKNLFMPSQLPLLIQSIINDGFVDGFSAYASQVFQRDTIETIIASSDNLSEFIQDRLAQAHPVDFNNTNAKLLNLTKDGVNLQVIYEETLDGMKVLGYLEGDTFYNWNDPNNPTASATVKSYLDDGTIVTKYIKNGATERVEIADPNENVYAVVYPGSDGSLGRIENTRTNMEATFFEGNQIQITIMSPDGSITEQDAINLLALSQGKRDEIASFFFGNGFNNEAPEDNLPAVVTGFIDNLKSDGTIADNVIYDTTLYEQTSQIDNVYRWAKGAFLGNDELNLEVEQELITHLNSMTSEQREGGIVYFTHSGHFKPLTQVLERRQDVNVHTLINFEGPYVGDDVLDNPNLRRLINVNGTAPPQVHWVPVLNVETGVLTTDFKEFEKVLVVEKDRVTTGDFYVPFLDKREFQGIENFNFEILGARHTDFSYDPSKYPENPTGVLVKFEEINRMTNRIMRDMYQASLSDTGWQNFLDRQDVSLDSDRGVYIIDPMSYTDGN